MSNSPLDNAPKKIAIKRKRASAWPLAKRPILEEALNRLIAQASTQELTPSDELRIHPSTEARGSGYYHGRRIWGCIDLDQWTIIKVHQHAQDRTSRVGRFGFEGGFVFSLNSKLAKLLRSIFRGGGENAKTKVSSRVGGCGSSASGKAGDNVGSQGSNLEITIVESKGKEAAREAAID